MVKTLLSNAGVKALSLVVEVRFHMPRGQKPKQETSNHVINSIKTFKMVPIKKKESNI